MKLFTEARKNHVQAFKNKHAKRSHQRFRKSQLIINVYLLGDKRRRKTWTRTTTKVIILSDSKKTHTCRVQQTKTYNVGPSELSVIKSNYHRVGSVLTWLGSAENGVVSELRKKHVHVHMDTQINAHIWYWVPSPYSGIKTVSMMVCLNVSLKYFL